MKPFGFVFGRHSYKKDLEEDGDRAQLQLEDQRKNNSKVKPRTADDTQWPE